MNKSILGIHHITAITGDAQQNIDFYTGVLGLRLVKVTVNFDDPGSYHFYYGDGRGSPGTILTFFAWPGARRGRHGNSQVTATSFAVPQGSLPFWCDRFATQGVASDPPQERFGQRYVPFTDGDGMRLELVEAAETDAGRMWEGGSVPLDFAIHGFHSATLSEAGNERTAALLTETMGFRTVGQEQNRFRYEVNHGGSSRTVDVIRDPGTREGLVAVGTVHHIAWRTADDAQQGDWRREIGGRGYDVTPVMDRIYFHSIYFHEPGGILFEIATDVPGFAVDESLEQLGSGLKLPPWLEQHRSRIERTLPVIERLPHKQGVAS
jgi:catechol 2,3-dioxygenase-like lactoylglutathione lyase family enzyme